MTIFEAGEDGAVAAAGLVDIICESSEFSVNDFG